MTTAPDWLRTEAVPARRSRWRRLRGAGPGALLAWGLVAAAGIGLLWGAVAFGLAVQARSTERAALEQAAVDALPPDLPVVLRGVFAAGDATGYATAFSPLPPAPALRGLAPGGGSRWRPVPGADAADEVRGQRGWVSASGRFVLTVDALSCANDRAPAGCPDGGSALTAEVVPGGPNSDTGPRFDAPGVGD